MNVSTSDNKTGDCVDVADNDDDSDDVIGIGIGEKEHRSAAKHDR